MEILQTVQLGPVEILQTIHLRLVNRLQTFQLKLVDRLQTVQLGPVDRLQTVQLGPVEDFKANSELSCKEPESSTQQYNSGIMQPGVYLCHQIPELSTHSTI